METIDNDIEENAFGFKRTPEAIYEDLKALFQELEETPNELALRMKQLGDYRSFATIQRSIQRMLSQETGVSGEMLVIVKMLVNLQRLRNKRYAGIKWENKPNGSVMAIEDDFIITLHPKSRGRWLVNLVHTKTGYSPSWPAWQPSIEAAKKKALTCLSDAHIELAEIEKENPQGLEGLRKP